ncbi:hypothetical protein RJT34_05147 [Clitoria ternatea]|uniref:Pentatricopeptide repeat-containing protein n=1 Tax=Clitoria ternatea TaxID=43366 RepID=A0AAN9K451_CLITE
MLSKLRILNLFSRRLPPTMATKPLCSVVQSQESPQLPSWVKFSDNPTPLNAESNDDFVIPSLSHWVDTHMLSTKPKPKRPTQSSFKLLDVDAITALLNGRFSSPDLIPPALDGHGFRVSNDLVEQVLNRFSNDFVPALGFFTWAKSQTGYEHSPQLYNLMVDILGKSGSFDRMWGLVEEMKQLEGYVTLDTMSKVIRRLAKASKHQDAIDAFRRMGEFGVEKDTVALNVLLDALVKGDSVEHACNALSEFKSLIPLNCYSFNVLIHGWCKARNFEKAWKMMEEMKEHGFEPDVFSYTTFIEAYGYEKDFRKVDQILEQMRENGCPPNTVTYTIVMLALGKARQLSEALKVYERMKSDGCVPDPPFYSSLIFILGKAGRLKDVCDVFEDMPKQGVVRDVVTYNTMISIACAHSQEETALRLLKEIEEGACKPDVDTYHALLKMCCKKKRMKVLKFLLDHMLKNDLSPDVGTYTLLVRGLCKSGKLEHACLFFEEMILRGLTPKYQIFKQLVKGLESKGMVEDKERVEKLMERVFQK